MSLAIRPSEDGVVISVKVVPGASRDRVMGLLGDALKVAVSRPPSGGEANRSVVRVLSEYFRVPERAVSIVAGHANPRKQVQIRDMTAQGVREIVTHQERQG